MPVEQTERVAELEAQVAGLIAQRAEVAGQLWAAIAQSSEEDDQVLVGRLRETLAVLGESEEPFMIQMGELYAAVQLDYAINRRRSIRNIQESWRNHLQAAFEHVPAHGLSADSIGAYIIARQKEGATNATINREMSLLKRAFKLAIRTNKLSRAPWIPHLRENNVRRGYVTNAQYPSLAREAAKVGVWMQTLFHIGFTYGWRKSELLGLKVRQVDLLARTLVLDPGTTKNDDSREVRLTDEVVELLTECIAGKAQEDYVFTRDRESNNRRTKIPGGKIIDFRDDWAKVCLRAGCPGLLFHDLRRSAVRRMIACGVREQVAMRITGHKTRSVFDRYHILDQADLDDAVEKLERKPAEGERAAAALSRRRV